MVDYLLVAALHKELNADVLRIFRAAPLPRQPGQTRTYYSARIETSNGTYELRLVCVGRTGAARASAVVTNAIARWAPRHVIMIGIAAVMPGDGRQRGDILVADRVVDIPERKRRPQRQTLRVGAVADCDSALVSLTREQSSKGVHVGVIVSQPDLSRDAHYRDQLRATVEDFFGRKGMVIGLEMEGGGLASAIAEAETEPRPTFAMIKGGVDWGNYHKGDFIQTGVARKVARFVKGLLELEPVSPLQRRRSASERPTAADAEASAESGVARRISSGRVEVLSNLHAGRDIRIGDVRIGTRGRKTDRSR